MSPKYSPAARDEPDNLRTSKNAEDASLLNSSDVLDDISIRRNYLRIWPRLHITALYTLISVLFAVTVRLSFLRGEDLSLGDLFTPARDVVEYHEHTFSWNFWDKGPYMGFPTDEKDGMWSDLYNFGTSAIPNEDASFLHDTTVPVPGSTTESLVMLDVWHQLHCLNTIRKAIYPERWPEIWSYHDNGTVQYDTVEMLHIDHCIDHIRQSLMCFSDVSPTSFFFDPRKGNNPKMVGTHMCRNFGKVKEWAVERQAELGTGQGHSHGHI